jgi:hypothetical protein
MFSIVALPLFTHIIIFLLPGSYLPPNTTGNIYIQLSASQGSQLLGEISNEKPSAMFESPVQSELPKARIRVGIEIAARKDAV